MEFDCTRKGETTLLAPNGSVNTESAPKLEKKLLELLNSGERRLVVDFVKVDYISSAGLRVLLMTAKRLKAKGGALALCGMSPGVAKIFALCGFERDFTIVPGREQALERVAAMAPTATSEPPPLEGKPASAGGAGVEAPPPPPKATPASVPPAAKAARAEPAAAHASSPARPEKPIRPPSPPAAEAASPPATSPLAASVVRALSANLLGSAISHRSGKPLPAEVVRRLRQALGN